MARWQALLACPHCGSELAEKRGALVCAAGHSFDIARQGYVNLLPGGADVGTADTREMVASRRAFFASGHYRRLVERVAAVTADAVSGVPGCVIDAGAGTGEYLAAVLEATPGRVGLALDLSKHAARHAARVHPDAGAVVCDIWGSLPVQDGVAAAVLCVFAPRNATETARVLAPGGALVVVTPTTRHLGEIVGPLGMLTVDPDKSARLERTLGADFVRQRLEPLEYRATLSVDDMVSLAMMGPSARHATPDGVRAEAERLGDGTHVSVSVDISVWHVDRSSDVSDPL